VRQPFVTKAGLGSEPKQRRIQSRFGRADQFPGVTKLCRRNGAANWAECSGGGVRSRGCFGASQSFGLRRQASWLKVWRGGRVDFDATERAHSGTEARLTRNAGGEVWSRPPRKLLQMEPNGKKPIKMIVSEIFLKLFCISGV
jgi:hypothetical protein